MSNMITRKVIERQFFFNIEITVSDLSESVLGPVNFDAI